MGLISYLFITNWIRKKNVWTNKFYQPHQCCQNGKKFLYKKSRVSKVNFWRYFLKKYFSWYFFEKHLKYDFCKQKCKLVVIGLEDLQIGLMVRWFCRDFKWFLPNLQLIFVSKSVSWCYWPWRSSDWPQGRAVLQGFSLSIGVSKDLWRGNDSQTISINPADWYSQSPYRATLICSWNHSASQQPHWGPGFEAMISRETLSIVSSTDFST